MPTGVYDHSNHPTCFKKGQNVGNKHPQWKGGKTIGSDKYIFIHSPNHPFCDNKGYVREHRLIMEKHLGRLLNPLEKVHHINGNKQDNRIDNLCLFTSQVEHMKTHMADKSFGFQKGHKYYPPRNE